LFKTASATAAARILRAISKGDQTAYVAVAAYASFCHFRYLAQLNALPFLGER